MSSDTCRNCSAPEAIHQYGTMKCPMGGYESGRWSDTTFVPDDRDELSRLAQDVEELKSEFQVLVTLVSELSEITRTLTNKFAIRTVTTSCQCGTCETIFDYTQIMNDKLKECPNCHSGNWVFGSIDNA